MNTDTDGIATEISGRLQRAWNDGDGRAFAEPFTQDADFVDIRGEHHSGREAIAAGHQAIFDTVYKDSTVDYEVIRSRRLADGVIFAHTKGVLRAPSGPLAGESSAVQSLALVREGDEWKIAGFHNTLVRTT